MLSLPPPEQLGIVAAKVADLSGDWTARLERLGASSFHFLNVATGRWRVICLVPTSQAGHHQRVEAEAATPAEAIRIVLDKAEQRTERK
jgi:hypothetical protein